MKSEVSSLDPLSEELEYLAKTRTGISKWRRVPLPNKSIECDMDYIDRL